MNPANKKFARLKWGPEHKNEKKNAFIRVIVTSAIHHSHTYKQSGGAHYQPNLPF